MPAEHIGHLPKGLKAEAANEEQRSAEEEGEQIENKAEWAAFGVALLGFLFATAFYGVRRLDPEEARRNFAPIHWFLLHKWLFDELYAFLFVRPVLRVSGWVAAVDKKGIDWLADNSAGAVEWISRIDDWIDRTFVDSLVNLAARWTYVVGVRLRVLQTGNIRHYVMLLAVGTVAFFVLMSLYWNYALAGG
jgi:NADH-quinone oxidoreductase subunit L